MNCRECEAKLRKESRDSRDALLEVSLSVAVPMWIERLRLVPMTTVRARAHEMAQIIAEKGDRILFRSEKKGETANAFNALAEGLAALSFSPGGVRFLDLHFEGKHPDDEGT